MPSKRKDVTVIAGKTRLAVVVGNSGSGGGEVAKPDTRKGALKKKMAKNLKTP